MAGGAGGGRPLPAPAGGAAHARRRRPAGRLRPLRPAGQALRAADHPGALAVGLAVPHGGQPGHAGAVPGLVRALRAAPDRARAPGHGRAGRRLRAPPAQPPDDQGPGADRAPAPAADDRADRSGGRAPLVGRAGDRPVRGADGRRRRAAAPPRRAAEQDRRAGHPPAPGVRHHRRLGPGDARPPGARPGRLHRAADGRRGRRGAPGGDGPGHRRAGGARRAPVPAGRAERPEPPRPERAGSAALGDAVRLPGPRRQRGRLHDGRRSGGDQAGVAHRGRGTDHGPPADPRPPPAGAGGGEHPLRGRGRRRPGVPVPRRGGGCGGVSAGRPVDAVGDGAARRPPEPRAGHRRCRPAAVHSSAGDRPR